MSRSASCLEIAASRSPPASSTDRLRERCADRHRSLRGTGTRGQAVLRIRRPRGIRRRHQLCHRYRCCSPPRAKCSAPRAWSWTSSTRSGRSHAITDAHRAHRLGDALGERRRRRPAHGGLAAARVLDFHARRAERGHAPGGAEWACSRWWRRRRRHWTPESRRPTVRRFRFREGVPRPLLECGGRSVSP